MVAHGDAHHVSDALVLARAALLVELKLRLDVLGGERDADLQPARDAACSTRARKTSRYAPSTRRVC